MVITDLLESLASVALLLVLAIVTLLIRVIQGRSPLKG